MKTTIVMDDERAARLDSFPPGSIVFDDERVADMKALPVIDTFPSQVSVAADASVRKKQEIIHMSAPKIFFTMLPSGYCPVQAEGFVDGYPFYFRSRGEHMRFNVAASGIASAWANVAWCYREKYKDGEPFAAGGASMEECLEFINRAAARWFSDKGGEICARWGESDGGEPVARRIDIYEENPNKKFNHKEHQDNNIMNSDVQMCMFWYENEATFLHFKEVCTDPDVFEYNYKEWQENVEKTMAGSRKIGCEIRKIHVAPDEFLLWCKTNALQPDGAARSRYASDRKGAETSQVAFC